MNPGFYLLYSGLVSTHPSLILHPDKKEAISEVKDALQPGKDTQKGYKERPRLRCVAWGESFWPDKRGLESRTWPLRLPTP